LHYDLDIYKCYLPLSLFTNNNLHTILHDANSLPLKKINPTNHKSKPPLVLNIDLFKKKFGCKDGFSHPAWTEAMRNYVCFAAKTGKDRAEGAWAKCWDMHFGFFNTRPDLISSFLPTLNLDIRMRKEYNALPLNFSLPYYHEQYKKAKFKYRIKNVESSLSFSHPGPTFQSHDTSLNHPAPSHFPRLAAPFELKPSSSNRNLPFCKGTGSNPSSTACLICAWRGHTFAQCKFTIFEDNCPMYATALNGNLIIPKSSQSICHSWNIHGDTKKKCIHPAEHRIHICSFCGDKSHFTFAWKCQSRPAISH
jgi:hypothetical protein